PAVGRLLLRHRLLRRPSAALHRQHQLLRGSSAAPPQRRARSTRHSRLRSPHHLRRPPPGIHQANPDHTRGTRDEVVAGPHRVTSSEKSFHSGTPGNLLEPRSRKRERGIHERTVTSETDWL